MPNTQFPFACLPAYLKASVPFTSVKLRFKGFTVVTYASIQLVCTPVLYLRATTPFWVYIIKRFCWKKAGFFILKIDILNFLSPFSLINAWNHNILISAQLLMTTGTIAWSKSLYRKSENSIQLHDTASKSHYLTLCWYVLSVYWFNTQGRHNTTKECYQNDKW